MAGTTSRTAGRAQAPPAPHPSGPERPSEPVRRRPRRAVVLLALGLTALLAGTGVWLVYGSPWFRLEAVSVRGLDALTRREVVQAAAVPLGAPSASLDTGAVERRVRALRRVEDVRVEQDWPHGVTVDVTERTAVLLVAEDGGWTEVDIRGVRFGSVDRRPAGPPELVVDLGGPVEPPFTRQRLRQGAARAVSALPDSVRREVRTVRVRSFDTVTLELTKKRTVVWGSGERSARKAKSLAAVMKAAPGARQFDVSVPNAPAVSGS